MKTTCFKSIMGGFPKPTLLCKSIVCILLMLAVLLGLGPAGPPARADSQGLASTITAPTNTPATVASATAVTQTNVVQLRQPRGIAVSWTFCVQTNAVTTSPCTIWLYPTADGTNYSTKTPFTLTAAANSTTPVTVTTNWQRASLEGYTALNFGMISNGCGGILTNLGLVVNIPNQ